MGYIYIYISQIAGVKNIYIFTIPLGFKRYLNVWENNFWHSLEGRRRRIEGERERNHQICASKEV